MSRVPASFVLGLIVLLIGLSAAPAAAQLRVLSYNIHHAEGGDGELDLERIAGVIRSADADVVVLQEVDVQTERAEGLDQAAELARLTRMEFVFGSNLDFEGGNYGNAVLSRLPILDHTNHSLPNPDDTEPRGALEVAVLFEQDTVTVISTHLDHQSEQNRWASAERLNEIAADLAFPGVLAGDINDVPTSETLSMLAEQWTNATADRTLPTSPASEPVRQIDYVMYHPAGQWSVIDTQVLEQPVASDHRPILAVLALRDAPSGD